MPWFDDLLVWYFMVFWSFGVGWWAVIPWVGGFVLWWLGSFW